MAQGSCRKCRRQIDTPLQICVMCDTQAWVRYLEQYIKEEQNAGITESAVAEKRQVYEGREIHSEATNHGDSSRRRRAWRYGWKRQQMVGGDTRQKVA